MLGALQRPAPFLAATLSSAVFLLHATRQASLGDEERHNVRPILGAILGGVMGEALSYVVVGVPAESPGGPVWAAVGAGGVGGAVGVAMGVYVSTAIATARGCSALYVEWRRSR